MNIRIACQRLFPKGVWLGIPEIDETIRKHSKKGLQGTLLVYIPVGAKARHTAVFRQLAEKKKLNYFIYTGIGNYRIYNPKTTEFDCTEDISIIRQTPRIVLIKKHIIWESWSDFDTIKLRLA